MWDTSIILLSSFIGGQTYVECSLLHINVLLRKPICADALYERIKLAVTCTSRGDTVEQRLAQILRELGMREQTIGYQCALLTVCLYRETNGASITKIIYHSVAQQLNSEGGNVERNMRYAVHRAWDKCDKAVLARYFGEARAQDKEPPSQPRILCGSRGVSPAGSLPPVTGQPVLFANAAGTALRIASSSRDK